MELFFISYRTGCSCCSDENHTRGPYITEDAAQRRIDRFMSGKDLPLASQYAKYGRYGIIRKDAEVISRDRWIIDDMVFPAESPLLIDSDGAILNGRDDKFTSEELW